MEPFHFGTDKKNLLGLYHPPGALSKDRGVVICPPIMGEYMRSHSCLRNVAIELSSRGFHVLRFDYSGTGDSGGDIADARLKQWIDEVLTAANELRSIGGITNISLVGVRLGAVLAMHAAGQSGEIGRIVAWDPIESGNQYVDGLLDTYSRLISSHEFLPDPESQLANEYLTGYSLERRFLDQLRNLSATELASPIADSLVVLQTEKESFQSGYWAKNSCECLFIDYPCDWHTYSESVIFGGDLVSTLVTKL